MVVGILSLPFLVAFLTESCGFGFFEGNNPDRIRLRDIEVLNLYQSRMTNGRRVSSVSQLKCVGGSAGCYAFVPQVVQCVNRGWDGYDVQWECKADMDNGYRFGQITVNCEGYDYPDDPFVLRGSCGLEYTIELTEEGRNRQTGQGYQQQHYHRDSGYQQGSWTKNTQSTWLGDLVTMGIVVVVGYIMFKACCGHRRTDIDGYQTGSDYTSPPPPYTEHPDNQGSQPHPPGFKPEYTSHHTNANSTYNQTPTSNFGSGSGSGGGFWTGAATGGLVGYLFGSRGSGYRRNYGYGSGYGGYGGGYGFGRRGWGSGFGSGWSSGSGGRSWGGSSRSSGSSGSRTASGFGGTSRR